MIMLTLNVKQHNEQLNEAITAIKEKRDINHIYFVACGGSKALFGPAQYILDRELTIPSSIYSSNEFVHRQPKSFDEQSVVITCSHSGNTPETVRATELAREKGALTIALSNLKDSPLWEAAEYPIHYSHRQDEHPEENNNMILYSLVFGILNSLQPDERYERALNTIPKLPEIYEKNIKKYENAAKEFGRSMRREKLIYTMASGGCYDVAYSFSICLLMEMQWIHSSCIHSGEYFHGPFEVTDDDVPFIIIEGLDETRPLDERAYNFCKKFSQKITLIDAANFDMNEVDDDLLGYFAPLVVNAVLRPFADELAEQRGHMLSVRRYMWKMEY